LQNCPGEKRRGKELFKSEKYAILSFYDLGLRVGFRPSKQTTKPTHSQNCLEEKRREEELFKSKRELCKRPDGGFDGLKTRSG
jgi:hypothetical protein